MPDNQTYIDQTKKWLSTVVIGQNFCPFAKREYDNDHIHYTVIETADLEGQLEQIILECAALDKAALDKDRTRETTLLIFPTALSDFEDYLDTVAIATDLLETQAYEGVYQLASFHPDYRFESVPENDPSHYTNRSPYPMIHILREASLETALAHYPNPETIPARNIDVTRGLGLNVMQGLLAACYE